MKKNLFYAFLFFAVSFASCKKDNNNEIESQGTVQFGLSVSQQQSGQKSMSTDEVPSSIVISIADSKGKVAVESKKIALFNMNGSYISESLSLVTGNYNITKFLVLNNFDSVIYATPLKGSNLAYLVTTPLPIVFNISKNNVTKVVPEVLSAKSFKPEDFGFSSFSFDVVETFDFLATVMVYNHGVKNWELTTANIIIRTADSTIAYNDTLDAITNQITLRDNSMSYILSVSKVGYLTYTATFTADELKLYFRSEDKGPLIIRLNSESVTDIDGNQYKVVKIGTQVWMAENLKTTKYNDGTDIILLDTWKTWVYSAGYCWYNNDINNRAYGAIYNVGYINNSNKLCPTNWHIPSRAEWNILISFLGDDAAIKLKEVGQSHWTSPNTGTNESGFTAIAGGMFQFDKGFSLFHSMGELCIWWSNDHFTTQIYNNAISTWQSAFYWDASPGFYVRCLKN